MEVSQYRLAKGIGVPPRRINEIVHGKRAMTADTALRLGKFFGREAQFWMNLQSHYDLEIAKDAIAGKLDREVEVLKADLEMRRAPGKPRSPAPTGNFQSDLPLLWEGLTAGNQACEGRKHRCVAPHIVEAVR